MRSFDKSLFREQAIVSQAKTERLDVLPQVTAPHEWAGNGAVRCPRESCGPCDRAAAAGPSAYRAPRARHQNGNSMSVAPPAFIATMMIPAMARPNPLPAHPLSALISRARWR